jgi:hypothetical protein
MANDNLIRLKEEYDKNLIRLNETNKYEKQKMNEQITKLYNDYQVRLNTLRQNQQVELSNVRNSLDKLNKEKQELGVNINNLETNRQNILQQFRDLQSKYEQLQRDSVQNNQQKDASIQQALRSYENKYNMLQEQNKQLAGEIERKNRAVIEMERMREEYNNLQNKYRELMEAPPVINREDEEARQEELERVRSQYDELKQLYDSRQNELRSSPITLQQPTIIQPPSFQSQPQPQQTVLKPLLQQPALQQPVLQSNLGQTIPETIKDEGVIFPLADEKDEGTEEPGFFERLLNAVTPKTTQVEPSSETEDISEIMTPILPEVEVREVDKSPILKMPTPLERDITTTGIASMIEKEEPKIIYKYKPCKRKSSRKKSSKRKKSSSRRAIQQPIIYIQTSYDGKDGVSVSKGNISFPRKPKSQKKSSKKSAKKGSKKGNCSKIKSLLK